MVNSTTNLYDLTNFTINNGLYDFIKSVNDLTGQIFMITILIAGFVILFISMKNSGTRESFMGSSFIIGSLAILFAAIDFIPTLVAIVIVLIFAGCYAFIFTRRDFF